MIPGSFGQRRRIRRRCRARCFAHVGRVRRADAQGGKRPEASRQRLYDPEARIPRSNGNARVAELSASASKSRGVATPSVTRLVRRSRSRMPAEFFVDFLADDGLRFQFGDGLEPRFDFDALIDGRKIQERSRRAPMPVAVSSSAEAGWPTVIFAGWFD